MDPLAIQMSSRKRTESTELRIGEANPFRIPGARYACSSCKPMFALLAEYQTKGARLLSGRLLQSWLDPSTLKHEPAYQQMMHAAGADIREAASCAVERAEGRTIREVELRVRIGELRLHCN